MKTTLIGICLVLLVLLGGGLAWAVVAAGVSAASPAADARFTTTPAPGGLSLVTDRQTGREFLVTPGGDIAEILPRPARAVVPDRDHLNVIETR